MDNKLAQINWNTCSDMNTVYEKFDKFRTFFTSKTRSWPYLWNWRCRALSLGFGLKQSILSIPYQFNFRRQISQFLRPSNTAALFALSQNILEGLWFLHSGEWHLPFCSCSIQDSVYLSKLVGFWWYVSFLSCESDRWPPGCRNDEWNIWILI